MITIKNMSKPEIDVFFDGDYEDYDKIKTLNNFVNGMFVLHESFYKMHNKSDEHNELIESFINEFPALIGLLENDDMIDDKEFFYVASNIYRKNRSNIKNNSKGSFEATEDILLCAFFELKCWIKMLKEHENLKQ